MINQMFVNKKSILKTDNNSLVQRIFLKACKGTTAKSFKFLNPSVCESNSKLRMEKMYSNFNYNFQQL